MCGLCGVATNSLDEDHLNQFRDLFFLSTFRGLDSSGSFWVYQKLENEFVTISHQKSLLDSISYMYRHNPWAAMLAKDVEGKIIAGHCRYATIGKISDKNAHPFNYKHIVGMHNGTLKSFKLPDGKTDSEYLIEQIAEKGIEETVKTFDYNDAAAIVWFDKNNSSLNFFRNYHRPLHFLHNKDYDIFAWASDASFIKHSMNRCGYGVKELDYQEFLPRTWYSYIPKLINGRLVYDWANPFKKEVQQSFFPQRAANGGGISSGPTRLLPTYYYKPLQQADAKIIDLREHRHPPHVSTVFPKKGIRGVIKDKHITVLPSSQQLKYSINDVGYNYKEIQEKLNEGCLWDGIRPKPEQFEQVLFLNFHEFLCPVCAKDKRLVRSLTNSTDRKAVA